MNRIPCLVVTLLVVLWPGILSRCCGQTDQTEAPYSILISTPKPVINSGAQAIIKVVLRNTSSEPIIAYMDKGADALRCGYRVHVYNAANQHQKMTPWAWFISGKKPAADDHNDYHGYPDFSFTSGAELGLPLEYWRTSTTSFNLFKAYNLEPGEYTIWVERGDPFWVKQAVTTSKTIVRSNVLRITVTAPTQ